MIYGYPEVTPYTSPEQATKLRKEADFIIKYIKLVAYNGAEYDITLPRMQLNIYEDIFNNCVTGDITLQDANDLPELMPIIGQERLKIKFTRPTPTDDPTSDDLLDDIEVNLRVYDMTNRQLQKDKLQIYTLHFISDEFVTDLKTKLQRAYIGMPFSDMVIKAFAELKSDKPLIVEHTKFDHDYVVPNISPIEFINTVAARSTSAEGNGSTYVFYSDREEFHYVTIGKLLLQAPAEDYLHQASNILKHEDSHAKDRTIGQDLRAVEAYGFAGSFNVLHNLATGMYASRLWTYDIVRQIWELIDFEYDKEFGKFNHLDKHNIHTSDFDAFGSPPTMVKFLGTNKDHDKVPWIAGREPGIKPNHVEDYTLYRYSQIQQINNAKIKVAVSGDPRRKVGQVVNFLLPQAMGNLSEQHPEELNKYLQGKYLIMSLTHRLSQNAYYMEMELVKDTFFSEIEHIDPNEVYADIW